MPGVTLDRLEAFYITEAVRRGRGSLPSSMTPTRWRNLQSSPESTGFYAQAWSFGNGTGTPEVPYPFGPGSLQDQLDYIKKTDPKVKEYERFGAIPMTKNFRARAEQVNKLLEKIQNEHGAGNVLK